MLLTPALLCLESATSSVTSSEPLWCEDYTKLQIPVLLFGGWHDGYTNAAFRLAERLPNCRTVLGPWSHNWPDTAVPGPNIAYLDECLQFWSEHLKQEQTGHLHMGSIFCRFLESKNRRFGSESRILVQGLSDLLKSHLSPERAGEAWVESNETFPFVPKTQNP